MWKGLIYFALCSIYFFFIHSGGRWDVYPAEEYSSVFFKILPVAALGTLTLLHEVVDDTHNRLKNNVALGLLFSLFGDICLVWRFELLIPGMIFFGIAHFFYARAFKFSPIGDVTTAMSCLVPGTLVFLVLAVPNIPETSLKIFGLLYSSVISIMWWRCVVYFKSTDNGIMFRACLGAFIFMTSDFLICLENWITPVPYPSLLIMITYYSAQFLIASSVLEYQPAPKKTS